MANRVLQMNKDIELTGDAFLQISPEGITARDEKVFRFAHKRRIPLFMLTSGRFISTASFKCFISACFTAH